MLGKSLSRKIFSVKHNLNFKSIHDFQGIKTNLYLKIHTHKNNNYFDTMSTNPSSASETSNIYRSQLTTACPSDSFYHMRTCHIEFTDEIQPPNIEHELNIAVSIMQQGSFITGDNLFDHLADMIKFTLKENPDNVMDYIDELSFNMRQQKFRLPEQFPWTCSKPIDIGKALCFMNLMRIPKPPKDTNYDVCKGISWRRRLKNKPKKIPIEDSESGSSLSKNIPYIERKLSLNENIQRLHLYWALCGFNLSNEEVTKLTYAAQKVQFHQSITHARFWGIIYGLKKSYYIVEADLIQSEKDKCFERMRQDVMERIRIFQEIQNSNPTREKDLDLIPGSGWTVCSQEQLAKMNSPCAPVPFVKVNPVFDVPPEPAGTGLNRKTYFVVNSLDDEWIELPVVEPKQIQVSRIIKKYFQGDLDADVVSHPCFPGTERNYLRAMIARITSGTYVAPRNYYRKLTKQELMEILGEGSKYEIEDLEGEEEEELIDNDALIIENENYHPNADKLKSLDGWVHVRPNIIRQGRVNFFDEAKALKALKSGTYQEEEEVEETNLEEEDNENKQDIDDEYEPNLFSMCFNDEGEEISNCWSIRRTSSHHKRNQFTILSSNVWPGAHSFTWENYADTIYLGFGNKFTSRNIPIQHLPPIQEDYAWYLLEAQDPTVQMEEAWRLYHEKKAIEEHVEVEEVEDEEPC